MSSTILGIFASAGAAAAGAKTFLATVFSPPTATNEYANRLIGDGTDLYFVGAHGATAQSIIWKIPFTGSSITWQKKLANSTRIGAFEDVKRDSAGNLYAVGRTDATTNFYQALIAKYNSSGTVQWQRTLAAPAGGAYYYGIAIDSSDNIYCTGFAIISGGYYGIVTKYNTSGTLQWQRRIGDNSNTNLMYQCAVDSSGNVYAIGYTNSSGANTHWVVKYNSSGTLQFQKEYAKSSGVNQSGSMIAIDSSNNIYISGLVASGANRYMSLIKLDTAGAEQWQRRLGTASSFNTYRGLAFDSSNNIYINGYEDNTARNIIAKYNSSGTLQWVRDIDISGDTSGSLGSIYASGTNIYSAGYWGGATLDATIFVIPQDGTKTGTYTVNGVSWAYTTSALTDSTPTYTNGNTALTDAAAGLTDASSAFTESNTSLSYSETTI